MKQTETRPSLLIRIRDPNDGDAWNEFTDIYRPAIVRMARLRGLQNADAEDLAQQVLIAVARSIKDWKHDPERAKFRTWLHRITCNAVTNALSRRRPDQATGRKESMSLLDQIPDRNDSEQLTIQLRREVFRFAAKEIRDEFHSDTWQGFWQSTIQGLSVEQVARNLNKHVGSIYAARSRVMRRLRDRIRELQIIDEKEQL